MAETESPVIPRGRPDAETQLQIDHLRRQIGALHAARLKPKEIAERLGIKHRQVNRHLRWLKVLWREELAGTIADLRLREAHELDEMERDVVLQYTKYGGRRWIETRLKIKAQRAALLGLNAPTRHIGLSLTAAEAARLANEYGVSAERVLLEAKALVRG